ncbi:MAG: hypothetical protein R3346_00945 [Candidatus Spechtbacterales bacterium]|nr:hypothetical protein [Candidatus Spechtbacterales bacterium]
MPIFTKQQYYSAYDKSPSTIKDLLFAEETSQNIEKIVSRQNVENKTLEIAADIGYVLVGLIPVKKFPQALQEDAGLNEQTAKNIAHDVRAQIFAGVAQELAGMQSKAEEAFKNADHLASPKINTEKPVPPTSDKSESGPEPQTQKTEPKTENQPASVDTNKVADNSKQKLDTDNTPPKIEYVPKQKDGGQPDESVVREHKEPEPKESLPSNQPPKPATKPASPPTPPENKERKPVPESEDANKPTPEPTPPKKTPATPEDNKSKEDQELLDEIFPAPPSNLPGTDSKKPSNSFAGENKNNTENTAQNKNLPPIPDTHKVDLRGDNESQQQ